MTPPAPVQPMRFTARITPRLLPLTGVFLAALLAVKSIALVRAAVPANAAAPTATQAATTPATSPAAKPSPPPAAATPAPSPPAAAAQPVATTPPVSESERALLLDLRQRRQELEAREQEAAAREALLVATERRIGGRVDELKALQARLETLETNRRERDEASWRGLVKVYETMKPRDAATIMNELDPPVLLGVLDRMREAKLAPILAAMQPERARNITAELAQHRQRANAVARADATPAQPAQRPAPQTR